MGWRRLGAAGATANAVVRGAGLGAAGLLVCGLLAVVARLDGRDGGAAFGNATLAGAGAGILVAAAAGGIRIGRWAERDEMVERVERGRTVGTRRITALTAAAMLMVASGIAAAMH